MSYYQPSGVFAAGSLARGEDIRNETLLIESGFNKLPKLAVDGFGFDEHFSILDALESNHPVTLSQLDETKITVTADLAAARLYAEAAEISATSAAESQAAISTASQGITALSSSIIEVRNEAQEQAERSAESANLARDYAFKPIGQTVDGPGTRSALHYAEQSRLEAVTSKGHADTARSLTSGARKFVGYHDASTGLLPIAEPTATDRGKYWYVSIAGTLPGLGLVNIGDELTITAANQFETAALSSGGVRSVNGKTGSNIVISAEDLDAASRLHNHPEYLSKANNLSGLPSVSTARLNLGLGTAALKNVGTGPFDVIQRDANGNIPGATGTSSATAQRLAQAITFSLTGGVNGSVSTDFGGNVALNTTVDATKHRHDKLKPLASAINKSANTITQTNVVAARTGPDFAKQGAILSVPGGSNGEGSFRIIGFDDGTFGWQIADGITGQWKDIEVPLSKVSGDEFYLSKSGTAEKATRFASPRQIKVTGDVAGTSAAFDGSQDATVNVTLSPSTIMTKIKTVDGAGSGLDADTVDGFQASVFRLKTDPVKTSVNSLFTSTSGVTSARVPSFARAGLLSIGYKISSTANAVNVTTIVKPNDSIVLSCAAQKYLVVTTFSGELKITSTDGTLVTEIEELKWS